MSFLPKPQEIYRHFKGNLYQVMAVAEHTETGEQLVVYQALYGDFKIYARPLAMFAGKLDKARYPDARQEFRFALQGPGAAGNPGVPGSEGHEPERDEPEGEGLALDPLVLEFLDADSYEQKLNILAGLHYRVTDDMITTMAVACDIEIADGELEERYAALRNCLLTLERYECNRLR